mgnify:CR=1 FL=1
MEHIAVSVIVPIYNAEPWLEECVQSILDQDFPASYGTIEVLLIDDGALEAVLKEEADFFKICSILGVSPELMAFKLHGLNKKGYRLNVPVPCKSDFLAK